LQQQLAGSIGIVAATFLLLEEVDYLLSFPLGTDLRKRFKTRDKGKSEAGTYHGQNPR